MKNKQEIDFISSVMTAWHLIGLKSYLINLKKDLNKNIQGYIVIKRHPRNGFLINKSMFNFIDGIDCICIFEEEKVDIIKEIKKNNFNISKSSKIISPSFADIFLCKKIKDVFGIKPQVVVIDEGVGCYDTSIIRWIKSVYIDSNSKLVALKFFIKEILKKIVKNIYKIDIDIFTLFKPGKGVLIENKNVSSCYSKYFSTLNRDAIDIDSDKYIIFFTNPLSEENHIKDDDIKELYKNIVMICEKEGYDVFFRKHPRETWVEKYTEFNLLEDKAESSEDLLRRLNKKPSYIIGAHSTSLVTGKMFFNVPAITIGELLYPMCKTEYCKDLIRKYNINFQNIVNIPKSIHEIKKIIDS